MKTANQQSGGKKGRTEGYKFEGLVEESFNKLCATSSAQMVEPEKAKEPSDWSGGKLTTVKTDKNITKGGKIVTGISIKNSTGSTQMQVMAFKALIFELDRALPIPPDAKRALELFTGNSPWTSGETFEEMIEKEKIDMSSLDCDMDDGQEVRRKRLLWSSLPAAYSSSLLAYLEDPVVKERLLNVIYREGTASGGFADWQCWCDFKVNGKNNPDALVLLNLKDFINSLMGEQWTVNTGGRFPNSTLSLGPLTFQMKGSSRTKLENGKPDPAAKDYHNPQFNMSLSAVRKHHGKKGVKGKLTLFEGNASTAFSKARII